MGRVRSKSQWARAKYEKHSDDHNYVVLIGEISDSSFINFVSEFFHEDHGNEGKQCVVLRDCIPSHSMQMVLNNPEYIKHVVYLEGNP